MPRPLRLCGPHLPAGGEHADLHRAGAVQAGTARICIGLLLCRLRVVLETRPGDVKEHQAALSVLMASQWTATGVPGGCLWGACAVHVQCMGPACQTVARPRTKRQFHRTGSRRHALKDRKHSMLSFSVFGAGVVAFDPLGHGARPKVPWLSQGMLPALAEPC